MANPSNIDLSIDSSASRVDFDVALLWMIKRRGQFLALDGRAEIVEGMVSIQARVAADSATMKNPQHLRMLKSSDYFDVARHPWIEFRSQPFALTAGTARVDGWLSLRGVERQVTFDVNKPACLSQRPIVACTIEVIGSVRRSEFGMVANRRTLSDEVGLKISAVVNETPRVRP